MKVKTKILFLLHLPPPIHGSSMVGQYIKDSHIINNKIKSDYINLLASKSVEETGKLSVNKILSLISTLNLLFGKLVKNKPDLCYLALTTTGIAFFRDVLLITLLKLFKVKRVYHLHNKGVSVKQNGFLYSFFYRYVFKEADVIVLSKYLYSDIERYVPKYKTHICSNGIPTFKIQEKNELKEKVVKLLFLSNLIESKGIFILLKSLAIINQKGISFECNFIGGEGDISAVNLIKHIDELNLKNKVFYLGKKYGEEKHQIFSKSDIFVFPTYKDCFPLVILEAMEYGLPVISTNEGGILDMVEDHITGYIVKKQDPIDLANKIEDLINDRALRKEMGIKGRKKFLNHYKLEDFEKNISNILTNIIQDKV